MTSKIEIANLALTTLGATPISSLTENSKESILVNGMWDIHRRSLLRRNSWNFATKRVDIPRTINTPNHQYLYEYQLPSDFLRLIQPHNQSDYKIENNKLLSNSEITQIKYIADIEDTNLWSSDFVELFAAKLSAELAYPITRDKDVMRLYHSIYQDKLNYAIFADGNEDGIDEIPGNEDVLRARR
jgi:hypothetical protein